MHASAAIGCPGKGVVFQVGVRDLETVVHDPDGDPPAGRRFPGGKHIDVHAGYRTVRARVFQVPLEAPQRITRREPSAPLALHHGTGFDPVGIHALGSGQSIRHIVIIKNVIPAGIGIAPMHRSVFSRQLRHHVTPRRGHDHLRANTQRLAGAVDFDHPVLADEVVNPDRSSFEDSEFARSRTLGKWCEKQTSREDSQ